MGKGTGAWLFVGCMALAGCAVDRDDDARAEEGASQHAGRNSEHGPCVSYYADSEEVADRGRLVQLDITFRYGATRSARIGGGANSMTLDAQSRVEGTASQLACAWEGDDGTVSYDLARTDGDEERPFPARHQGTAQLSGMRVTRADGATVHEEVDVTGPLEMLQVMDLGPPDGTDAEACVILAFEAPLRGRSQLRLTAPGVQREEAMDPSALVLDGYSALSPKTYDGGDHRFLDHAFAICAGQEDTGIGQFGPPKGMTVSDDGRLWQRRGVWQRHASGPTEQRTVEFTLRVVPPTLPLD